MIWLWICKNFKCFHFVSARQFNLIETFAASCGEGKKSRHSFTKGRFSSTTIKHVLVLFWAASVISKTIFSCKTGFYLVIVDDFSSYKFALNITLGGGDPAGSPSFRKCQSIQEKSFGRKILHLQKKTEYIVTNGQYNKKICEYKQFCTANEISENVINSSQLELQELKRLNGDFKSYASHGIARWQR